MDPLLAFLMGAVVGAFITKIVRDIEAEKEASHTHKHYMARERGDDCPVCGQPADPFMRPRRQEDGADG